jgi:hypothetical protein
MSFFSDGEGQSMECTRSSGKAMAGGTAWIKRMVVKRECLLIILINLN